MTASVLVGPLLSAWQLEIKKQIAGSTWDVAWRAQEIDGDEGRIEIMTEG